MSQDCTLEQLQSVARYLSWMQKIFLGFLLLMLCFVGIVATDVRLPEFLIFIPAMGGLAGMLMLLICTYRCAKGSDRSGALWLLIVLIFKWIGLIVLSYLTRKWLVSHGVKVKNLGLSYELPDAPLQELESPGFSRF